VSGPALITGGAGFIGCNIADRLAGEGRPVRIFDALRRPGVERNLDWLKDRHGELVEVIVGDMRDPRAVAAAVDGASVVFHLAAQVAVTTSLVDPVEDFEINVRGAINLLEALRTLGARTPLVFASTNKVYGDLADVALEPARDAYHPADPGVRLRGVSERRPLDFHTPYGCSKGAADQYVLDYARSFGLPACVLRMSCIYGPRQMGTEDQGWVAHFLIRALAGEPITIYGDGRQVRDVLWVGDAVDAYLGAWRHIGGVAGRAFNLGGGPANAISLLQLVSHMEDLLGRSIPMKFRDWRAGDQRYYVSDTSAVRRELGLGEPLGWRSGIAQLKAWLEGASARTPEPAEAGA
jgi:CDP-paratose 2-epimerase